VGFRVKSFLPLPVDKLLVGDAEVCLGDLEVDVRPPESLVLGVDDSLCFGRLFCAQAFPFSGVVVYNVESSSADTPSD
jgi:hypothetical protein